MLYIAYVYALTVPPVIFTVPCSMLFIHLFFSPSEIITPPVTSNIPLFSIVSSIAELPVICIVILFIAKFPVSSFFNIVPLALIILPFPILSTILNFPLLVNRFSIPLKILYDCISSTIFLFSSIILAISVVQFLNTSTVVSVPSLGHASNASWNV